MNLSAVCFVVGLGQARAQNYSFLALGGLLRFISYSLAMYIACLYDIPSFGAIIICVAIITLDLLVSSTLEHDLAELLLLPFTVIMIWFVVNLVSSKTSGVGPYDAVWSTVVVLLAYTLVTVAKGFRRLLSHVDEPREMCEYP